MGCRGCFVPAPQRGDQNFDIVAQGRYHYQTLAMRNHADTLPKGRRDAYGRSTGLDTDFAGESALQKVTLALDLILTRPADPAHSEFQGITKLLHELLLDAILTPEAQGQYSRALRASPFPPGWPHISNPERHLGSYRLSEHERWAIVAPILLRL